MMYLWILGGVDGHTPIPCNDIIKWGEAFGSQQRIVAQTEVAPGITVSTVFIGINHRFLSDGPPILFESLPFGDYGAMDEDMWRYSTWEEAEAGHRRLCAELRARVAKRTAPK